MTHPLIPESFVALVRQHSAPGYPSGESWSADLPKLLAQLLDDWELEPTGPTRHGQCAIAVPVRSIGTGGDDPGTEWSGCILKVGWPHPEAACESVALRTWDGRGAVRLLRADPGRFALLLEQVDDRDLSTEPIDQACEVIGELLAALHRPGHPRLTQLAALVRRQVAMLRTAGPVMPKRYLDQATALADDLVADSPGEPPDDPVGHRVAGSGTDTDGEATLHTDLHYANVLAARRSPWLAIDPKPLRGDRAYEIAPALWNRTDDLGTGSQVRWSLRRRLQIICERAGIDEERARAWTIVREAVNAVEAGDLDPTGRSTPATRDRVSLAVTIIKAMND